MRIAGNKLKHLIVFFRTELQDLYSEQEVEAMIAIAVEKVLGFSKTELLLKTEENINQSDLLKLYDCAKDLKKMIPLQYILGETWFYDLTFKVDPHVLIPRPETEELVHLILEENKTPGSVLDIGTGSGCIPVTVKKHRPHADVFACDISNDALRIAEKNAALNQAPVQFIETDILKDPVAAPLQRTFGIIISNPPYIKEEERLQMDKNVLEHEPHLALFVKGENPVIFYERIIDLCATLLAEKGQLYFELNPLTANAVEQYAKHKGIFSHTSLLKDMSGAVRFFKGTKH